MGRRAGYVLSLSLLGCTPLAVAGDAPVPPPLFPVEGFDTGGQGPARAIAKDFNGDGLTDLVAGNVGHEQVPLSGGVSVLLGLGGVEFAA